MEVIKKILGLFFKSKKTPNVSADVNISTEKTATSTETIIKNRGDVYIQSNSSNLDSVMPEKFTGLYKKMEDVVNLLSTSVGEQSSLTDKVGIESESDFGRAFLQVAKEERSKGNIEEALYQYEEAEKHYKKANDYFQRAKILLIMSILANVQRKNKVEDSKYAEREAEFRNTALLLYIKSLVSGEYDRFKPQEFVELGALESRMGNFDNAQEYYEIAQKLCEKLGDRKTLANVLRLMGIMKGKDDRGGLIIGKKFLTDAKKLYENLEDDSGVAITFEALGDMNREHKNYSEALECYRNAWEKYNSADSTRRYFIAWHLYNTNDLAGNTKDALFWENEINLTFDSMPEEHQNYILKSKAKKAEVKGKNDEAKI